MQVEPEVRDALREGRPVVVLETALLTHGLPRTALPSAAAAGGAGWSAESPANLEAARSMQRAVREAGAVPATAAVIDGALRLGLTPAELARLGSDDAIAKASAANLASLMAEGRTAGTTVSATLVVCRLVRPGPVRVLATGGIGGVHAGWTVRLDVSADLAELASTPVCVVCSGAKSILDATATLEALEALAIPVVGYRTDWFPRFHASGDSTLPTTARAEDADAVARLCRCRWHTLGQTGAVVTTAAVPEAFALDPKELEAAVAAAETAAEAGRVRGPDRTPFLLSELHRLTSGRSLLANLALLRENARIAAGIASALAQKGS